MTSDTDDLEKLRQELKYRRELAEVAKAKDQRGVRVKRVLAVLVGAFILVLDFSSFVVGDVDQRILLGFSFAGALCWACLDYVMFDRPKWYKIIGYGALGGTAGGGLAAKFAHSLSVIDASGFGLGLGVNVGIAVALLIYGIAGPHPRV